MKCNSVMIVEDDVGIRDSLVDLLRAEGYDPSTADDGESAIEVLKKMTKPCLVLLDIAMPKMDGLQFIEKVREIGLTGVSHVIIMTALSKFKSEGHHVIQKPFDMEVLLEAVNDFAGDAKTC